MKNKRLFAILSSLFCVGAICGLFSLLTLPKNEDKITANASNVLVQTVNIPNLNIAYTPDLVRDGERVIYDDSVDYSRMHVDFSVFELSLYQNNDLDVNRYYLGLHYKSDMFYDAIDDLVFDYNFTDYTTDSEDIYLYSDYLTDVSIFDFNVYLYSMNVERYILQGENGVNYIQPYCDIVFEVKNINGVTVTQLSTKMKYGNLTYSNDISGGFMFSLLQITTYNDLPFDALPLRQGILLGNAYYDAMENDYTIGYNVGFNEGYNNGYSVGNVEGYNNGYNVGYQQGVTSQQSAINNAYNNGYADGLDAGGNMDSTTFAIFNGILQIGMLPVNIFLQLFDFTVLGINLKNFVLSLISTLIVLKVVHFVIGSGLGGGSSKQ